MTINPMAEVALPCVRTGDVEVDYGTVACVNITRTTYTDKPVQYGDIVRVTVVFDDGTTITQLGEYHAGAWASLTMVSVVPCPKCGEVYECDHDGVVGVQ